jgi:hypothetical protein
VLSRDLAELDLRVACQREVVRRPGPAGNRRKMLW